MASLSAAGFMMVLFGLGLAAKIRLRRILTQDAPLPFDCYVDDGSEYQGLTTMSTSGRTCENWLKVGGEYGPSIPGIGNHNYCRNPSGKRERPWCFTVDPNKEWEFCDVPKCAKSSLAPEPWVAPDGSKSADAAAKGPCTPAPPSSLGFTEYKAGRACMSNQGSAWWLIGNENTTAADPPACKSACSELPGTKYFTFWSAVSSGNCGCYRECVLVPEDLTVHSPTVYRLR
eukprot:TRINITY_DN22426_c0_g1_i1.p1 TRINITY_DN22426_c0_g1~~TRINITY_DN22426_c0_g1_i1.p1  ORF type:complete len:230 (+),score=28.75 TRINITY_DN22426_c0_g1_i1:64-753(+)